MDIHECERKAIADGAYDKAQFDLVSPTGAMMHCRWLDAYFGLIQVDGESGFCHTRDIASISGLSVENYHVPK